MDFEVVLNYKTKNCCLKCNSFNRPYIYCPVFNEIQRRNYVFDETGELDGCNLYSELANNCQTVHEDAIAWLYNNHPEAYNGFYERVDGNTESENKGKST